VFNQRIARQLTLDTDRLGETGEVDVKVHQNARPLDAEDRRVVPGVHDSLAEIAFPADHDPFVHVAHRAAPVVHAPQEQNPIAIFANLKGVSQRPGVDRLVTFAAGEVRVLGRVDGVGGVGIVVDDVETGCYETKKRRQSNCRYAN
jgi:hypothetical protein